MIHVITGPPCSGKSTHIERHASEGDIIIDLDRIALAFSHTATRHHEYPQHVRDVARAARKAAITAALDQPCNVWVIDTWPNVNRWAQVNAQITTLDPGRDVCIERARRDRPAWVVDIINEWYDKAAPTSREW